MKVGSDQWLMAFLQCHVMYGSDIGRDLQNLLEVDDLAVILNSKHRPLPPISSQKNASCYIKKMNITRHITHPTRDGQEK